MLDDGRFLKIRWNTHTHEVMVTVVHLWPNPPVRFYKAATLAPSRLESMGNDPQFIRALYAVTIDGLDEALDHEMWRELGRGYGGRRSWVLP